MTRSEIMSRVHSTDTSIELLLRKALWAKGLRYRKNDKTVFGKPDIVFKGKKIAIFCDSEFWHGKEFLETGKLPKNNREFWEKKMKLNIERDILVNKTLKEEGWTILRFGEKEIRKDIDMCLIKILSAWEK